MLELLAIFAAATADPMPAHEHRQDAPHIGHLTFVSSCTAAAQIRLVEGLEWLHSFEYARSEQQFSAAAAADPSCGIAYWGVAMTYYHPLWPDSTPQLAKGIEAIAKARQVGARTNREKAYIAALGAFYRGAPQVDQKTRMLDYESAMADLHHAYPDDPEASVFYALSLIASGTLDKDPAFTKEKKAGAILNAVLAQEPSHPGVSHYLIHNFDYPPLASLALSAARRYAAIAPDSSHAQHMPSHIFTRLGLWEESINSNLAAQKAAVEYEKSSHIAGTWDQQLHAMDYLAYAYLQTGRDRELAALVDRLDRFREAEPPSLTAAYAVTAIPARSVLERHRWSDAAKLELPEALQKLQALSNNKSAISNIHFARAVGAARTGDLARARDEVAELASLEQSLVIPPGSYDWRKPISIQRQIAEAWLAKEEHRYHDAERTMRAAADLDDATDKHPVTPGAILPAREQLGELLLMLGRPADALREYHASLTRAPRRLAGLYGAAQAAQLSGQEEDARRYFTELLDMTKKGDPALAEVKEAQAYLSRAAAPR